MRLTAEQKALWLAALRSGQYVQARQRLKNGEGYCCLGVLCVAALNITDEELVGGAELSEITILAEEALVRSAPDDEWGTIDYNMMPLPTAIEQELIHMNDGQEKSFAEIADYIEKNVEVAR